MITLQYGITIQNTPAIVWQSLWNDDTYRKWTAPFVEGSYAVSSWEKGEKVSFLTAGGGGMFGKIIDKVDEEKMEIQHLGEIKNGREEMKDWKNATESYYLSKAVHGTQLKVVLTMDEKNAGFETYFDEAFPKALAILKEICESA